MVPEYKQHRGLRLEGRGMAADTDGREPFLLPLVPFTRPVGSHSRRKEVKEHVMAIIGGGGANRFAKEVNR